MSRATGAVAEGADAAYGAPEAVRPRRRRRGAALGLGVALALPLVVAAPPPAQAAGQPGYCADASGVTVVVDFQALGGGVVVRCAPAPLPGTGTGLDALVAAGISLEGTRRWGDSFICRLGGQPAVTRALSVDGQPGYHEQCLDTPPSAAFWGYWYAADGGSWQFSQQGVKGHHAIAGGFEGWSFSLDASGSDNPPPRLTPTRPTTPVTPASGTPQSGGSGSVPTTSGSAATRSTAPTVGGAATPPGGSAATATAGPTTTTPGPTAGSGPGSASSTAAAGVTSSTTPPVVSGELASSARTPATSSGPSTGTVVGVGVLAFLLVAGAGTAWRRRRATDSS